MRISLRAVLFALIGLVAIGALVTSGALSSVPEGETSKSISASEFCSNSGISLLVDYGEKSGIPTTEACAENFTGNGWELFAAAGQVVEGTTEYPVGFVCRINNFPAPTDQPCTSTPTSAQGSWAYYYATSQLGNHWMFSATGATSRNPKCGDTDAWVFIEPGEESHEPSQQPRTFKCDR
jgi:hypothetical protein